MPTLTSTNCAPTVLLAPPDCPCRRRSPPDPTAATPGAAAAPRVERDLFAVDAPAEDVVPVGVARDASPFIATAGAATTFPFRLFVCVSGVLPGLYEMVSLLRWSIS